MTPDQVQPHSGGSVNEELEDLEATDEEADDLTGGINKLPGKPKPGEVTLTRSMRSTDE